MALDKMTEPLDFAMAIVHHLESVATTPEMRAAHNAVQGPVSVFYTSIPLDTNVWAAVKAVSESPRGESLAPVHKRFLKKTVSGFRRAGADLDAEGKRKLEALDVALTEATTKFSENVLDATNAYELLITEEEKLAGLPESARTAAREKREGKGQRRLAFHVAGAQLHRGNDILGRPDYQANSFGKHQTRAPHPGHMTTVLLLRRYFACDTTKPSCSGYRDFADLVLEERMAQTGAQAQAFLEDLYRKTTTFFDRENQSLAEVGKKFGL